MKPFLRKLIEFLIYSAVNGWVFWLIYGWTNHRVLPPESVHHWYADFELSIPLLPWMILIYFSLNLLTMLSLFVLSLSELRAYALSNVYAVLVAGVFFYFFPTQCGFTRPVTAELGIWMPMFDLLYKYDQPMNLVPSLHITYSALAVLCMQHSIRSPKIRQGLWLWFVLICVCVITTHQHHLLDVGSGFFLGYALYRYVFLRWSKLLRKA